MDYPVISIITPSFNQGKYIEKTIQSVLNQNYPHIEYIIVDGGSTDGSVEIIKKYEKHLKVWISEPDQGQSDAINKGLQYASGEIINWINSDDWIEPDALKEAAQLFSNKDINVMSGFSILHCGEKTILQRTAKPEKNLAKFISTGHIIQPSTFWRKKIFDEFSPIETSLHYMMDHYLWLQYILKYGSQNICFSDKIFANILLHENAKSVNQIKLFHYERQRIFVSLYSACNKKCLAYNSIDESSILKFSCANSLQKKIFIKINFYLLWEQLFTRNYLGERQKLNVDILFKIVFYFPFFFFFKSFAKIFQLKAS